MAIINQVFKTIMGITGEKPSLDTMLAIFDRKLENYQTLATPDPTSKPRSSAFRSLRKRQIHETPPALRKNQESPALPDHRTLPAPTG